MNVPECFWVQSGDMLNISCQLSLQEVQSLGRRIVDIRESAQRAVNVAWKLVEGKF